MNETRWWRYLVRLMGDDSQQEAAKKMGISKSNLSRWKEGAKADPKFVVKIARAYGANVLEALVEAEFITDEEAALREVVKTGKSVQEADTQYLLTEVMRRVAGDEIAKDPRSKVELSWPNDLHLAPVDFDEATTDNWRDVEKLAARTPDKDDPRNE